MTNPNPAFIIQSTNFLSSKFRWFSQVTLWAHLDSHNKDNSRHTDKHLRSERYKERGREHHGTLDIQIHLAEIFRSVNKPEAPVWSAEKGYVGLPPSGLLIFASAKIIFIPGRDKTHIPLPPKSFSFFFPFTNHTLLRSALRSSIWAWRTVTSGLTLVWHRSFTADQSASIYVYYLLMHIVHWWILLFCIVI